MTSKRNNTLRAQTTLVTEQNRLVKYFPEKIQKDVANNAGNIETQRDILLFHVQDNHPGMASLFNDNYYREIDTFIELMESKYVDEAEKSISRKLGIKKVRIDKRQTKERFRLITTKTKTGKEYKRTSPGNFENKKVTVAFITRQVKQGKNNKEITENYNKLATQRGWKTRTVSSIATLKSRSKIRK